jgi:feruloyl esterase
MKILARGVFKILSGGLFAAALAPMIYAHAAAAAGSAACESLASLSRPGATNTIAQTVPAGEFTTGGSGGDGRGFEDLPTFCRVATTLTPSSDSDIKVEVWMPASNWNGKFQAVGNGGWAGSISYGAMAEALRQGYATASTDTGHSGDRGEFAFGHPEKFVDFAYRSEHEMTLHAKSLVKAFYGSAPSQSYWTGCSGGGRQGLLEAERFPEDFNGILAGDPANFDRAAWAIWAAQQTLSDPRSTFPPSKYPMIHKAVVDACDAIDGVKDGLIDDPRKCHFDPSVLACNGDEDESCLTAPQVEALRKIIGPATSRTGAKVLPGFEPGTELSWRRFIGGPEPTELAVDYYRYVIFKDPKWDWRTFDVEKDFALAKGTDNVIAVTANIKRFAERGGKLLIYHGWADQQVPPGITLDYYQRATEKIGQAGRIPDSIRLFMAPGMAHCRGGDGPDAFDAFGALERWVEKGVAPDRIVASHVREGAVDRTRPLCPYPQVARYSGTGSIDDAQNFVCRTP